MLRIERNTVTTKRKCTQEYVPYDLKQSTRTSLPRVREGTAGHRLNGPHRCASFSLLDSCGSYALSTCLLALVDTIQLKT